MNSPRLAITINISNCTPSTSLLVICWWGFYGLVEPHQVDTITMLIVNPTIKYIPMGILWASTTEDFTVNGNIWWYTTSTNMIQPIAGLNQPVRQGRSKAAGGARKNDFSCGPSHSKHVGAYLQYTHTFSYIYTYTYTHMHLYTCNNCNKSLMAYCYFGIATPTRTNHCSFEVAVRLLYNFSKLFQACAPK